MAKCEKLEAILYIAIKAINIVKFSNFILIILYSCTWCEGLRSNLVS